MATVDKHGVEEVEYELPNGVIRPTGPMTEDEFVAWCDEDVKAEWVDGEVIIMSPASMRHQDIADWLVAILRFYVSAHRLGRVFGSEFMIRLGPIRRRRVPDVLFITKERQHLLRPNHFEGAPDLAIEVVSPDSEDRDRRDKYLDYQAAGVREYWIIDHANEDLRVYSLDGRGLYRALPVVEGRVASTVLPGFFVRPEWLWESPLPDEWETMHAFGLPA